MKRRSIFPAHFVYTYFTLIILLLMISIIINFVVGSRVLFHATERNNAATLVIMSTPVFHEKQVKELCALHALNNLFQKGDAFLKSELDTICYSLAPKVWFNPHKSFLGLGNYDVNVVMAALQNKGYQAVWFDRRKSATCLRLDKIFGFIMNIPNEYHLGYIKLPLQRRHWIAIRKVDDEYYNLDSKLKQPISIGQEADLLTYLQEKIENQDNQLFVVVTSDTKDWQTDEKQAATPLHNNS